MFSSEFDWALAAIAFVLGVIVWMGKGDPILNMFSSKENVLAKKKKKTPEQRKAYNRAIAIFLFILGISEVVAAVFSYQYPWVNFVSIGIVVLDLIYLCVYMKKNQLV